MISVARIRPWTILFRLVHPSRERTFCRRRCSSTFGFPDVSFYRWTHTHALSREEGRNILWVRFGFYPRWILLRNRKGYFSRSRQVRSCVARFRTGTCVITRGRTILSRECASSRFSCADRRPVRRPGARPGIIASTSEYWNEPERVSSFSWSEPAKERMIRRDRENEKERERGKADLTRTRG